MRLHQTTTGLPLAQQVDPGNGGEFPPPTRKPRQRRWAAITGVTLAGMLILVLTLATISSSSTGDGKTAPVARVLSVRVNRANPSVGYAVINSFVGRVEARRRSRVGFEIGGLLRDIAVEEGQRVEAGDVVARLDTDLLQSRREELQARLEAEDALLKELLNGEREEKFDVARAELRQAKAQYQVDQLNLRRAERLIKSKAIDREEYDQLAAAVGVSEGRVGAAQARLDELENGYRPEKIARQRAVVASARAELNTVDVRIRKSTLRAPFAGVVGERWVDEGTVVQAGDPVIELLEMGRLQAHVGVAGDGLNSLYVGGIRTVRVAGRDYDAQVEAIRPDRARLTRAVTVILAFQGDPSTLNDGDVARLDIDRQVEQAGYWLPVSALTEGVRGLWACFVAEPLDGDPPAQAGGATHRLIRRDLELLHQEAEQAYVRGTLEAGDLVVVTGRQRLVAGQPVTLAEEGQP